MTSVSAAASVAAEHGGHEPRRADVVVRAGAGVMVAALAVIAGAISYSHMRALAMAHGQAGWQAHAFPLSVDGIEIVASLVLLADRRGGRRPGWLPWAALAAGTGASLAANVAAAGADPVGRVISGWPALSLLVAIKLIAQLLVPGDRPLARGRPGYPGSRPAARAAARDGDLPAIPVPVALEATSPGFPGAPGEGAAGKAGVVIAGTGAADGSGRQGTGGADVAALLPAARVARDRVVGRDGTLTRDGLAAQLRRDGYAMRNVTVSRLLGELRHEQIDGELHLPCHPGRRSARLAAG